MLSLDDIYFFSERVFHCEYAGRRCLKFEETVVKESGGMNGGGQ